MIAKDIQNLAIPEQDLTEHEQNLAGYEQNLARHEQRMNNRTHNMLKRDDFKPATKFAHVRRHWPQIKLLLADGIAQEDILLALREEGLELSLDVFRAYLSRLRKREVQQPKDNKNPRSTAYLPPGTGGAMPLQNSTPQLNTAQTLPEFPDTMSARERRKAQASQYVPEEGYPLLRRKKGA